MSSNSVTSFDWRARFESSRLRNLLVIGPCLPQSLQKAMWLSQYTVSSEWR